MYKKKLKNFMLVIGVICTVLISSCSMNDINKKTEEEAAQPVLINFEQSPAQNISTGDAALFDGATEESDPGVVVTTSTESRALVKNIAAGKNATALSVFSTQFPASHAVDSLETTAWGSATTPDIQWIYVDLGAAYDIGHIVLKWFGEYYGSKYNIAHSIDGTNWTLLNEYTGTGGTEYWNFQHTSLTARYVGIYCTAKNSIAYGLAELEVYQKDGISKLPFPRNQSAGYTYYNGHTAPFGYEKMNKDLLNIYRNWLKDHLTEYTMAGVTESGYVVAADGTGGPGFDYISQSEAHGYGMMILAMMSGSGVLESMPEFGMSEKYYFDGMVRVYDNFRSTGNPYMMWWALPTDGKKTDAQNNNRAVSSAADGDIDMIYALLLADKQWGSTPEMDYITKAKNMIAAIYGSGGTKKDSLIEKIDNQYWLKIGDWAQYWGDNWKYNNISRPSDWITYSLRSFESASGATGTQWNDTINDVYKMYFYMVDNFSSQAGLLPDFVTGFPDKDGFSYSPAYQGWYQKHDLVLNQDWFEGKADGYYYYNACRVPWRIGSDIVLYDSANENESKKRLVKLAEFFQSTDPGMVWDCYKLDGTRVTGNDLPDPINDGVYGKKCFVAPIAVAFLAADGYNGNDFTPQLQTYWDYMAGSEENQRYFSRTINLLNMILISGNWWNPEAK